MLNEKDVLSVVGEREVSIFSPVDVANKDTTTCSNIPENQLDQIINVN